MIVAYYKIARGRRGRTVSVVTSLRGGEGGSSLFVVKKYLPTFTRREVLTTSPKTALLACRRVRRLSAVVGTSASVGSVCCGVRPALSGSVSS